MESFPAYERLINNLCQSYNIGYLFHPPFMTMYLRYGTRVLEKAPQYRKPGMTVHQFLKDDDAFMVSEAWWKASTPVDRDLLRRLHNRARAKFQS
jgi:hypothetical protein